MVQLTTAQMDILQTRLNNNDVSGFYAALQGYGDDYGRLGEGVTNNDTWQGQIANGFAESGAADNGKNLSYGSNDWIDLNKRLAQRHLDEYKNNSGGEPSWDQIQRYHNQEYIATDLDVNDWFPNKMLESSNNPAGLWEDWQRNDGGVDIIEDAKEIYKEATDIPYSVTPENIARAQEAAKFSANFGKALLAMDEDVRQQLVDDVLPFDDIADWLDQLSDGYGWALDNPDLVFGELPPWLQDALGPVLGTLGVDFSPGSGLGGSDPLTLDLDGDGLIELTSVTDGVYYDFWNDGFAEKTGWVAADDGMLVWDKDSDGLIEGFEEMIASPHPLSYVLESGWLELRDESNAFVQLGQLDDNGDGVIDAQDTIFSTLQVWQDLNQNGISEAGELFSLSDLNIANIDVAGAEIDSFAGMINGGFQRLIEGNTVTHKSTFTLNDGTSREIVDVWFDHDLQNSRYAQNYTLDIRTLFLPTLRSYGNLPDLHVAMSQNEGLLTQVESLATSMTNATDVFAEFETTKAALRSVLMTWAGVDENATPSAQDIGNDAIYAYLPEYRFLAEFTGIESEYLGTWFDERPFLPFLEEGIPVVYAAFDNVLNALGARLLSQTTGGADLFVVTPVYNPIADTF
ncbi:hypothetical protein KC799_23885, partial [candidate division KSB1 bacterium]|nr:hypothetical protein [candidate division KSB1 bacterium]